ncbi:MAG: beta-N-acetylhexosaminidase [Aerococcaceae bacterium]|nr:beta-N-acetylhexosaminidase [Aerococcaceae bacterium]
MKTEIWIESPELRQSVALLTEELGVTLSETGYLIVWERHPHQQVDIYTHEQCVIIKAKDKPHFFQGIFQWLKKGDCSWEYAFNRNGLMLDNSRNAVASVPMVKYLLRKLAIMGHTWYMLYMEDVYEIPEQPYFGSFRGRYSQQQLRELDAYAVQLGIELVPCIQTLAHVNQFFQWEHEEANYGDTEDILNVGRQKTLDLIEDMLRSLRSCFTTNTIHLGMDEAYQLGRGTYLNEFGLKDKTHIMLEHLNNLLTLCKKYAFEPLMWDDMFFSWYNEVEDTSDFQVPEAIRLMYWDYYQINPEHYIQRIQNRRKVTSELMFAGGAWRWTGYVPHHQKTLQTSIAALEACRKEGIRNVITTAWGDDGSEAPFYTALFGVALYAYLDCHETYDATRFDAWLQDYTQMSLEQWLLQGRFDLLEEFDQVKALDVTPSKYFLYQDLMMPMFMPYITALNVDYTAKMRTLAQQFEAQTAGNASINAFYAAYAHCLSIKWNLPYLIWQAYHQKDMDTLQQITETHLPLLVERLEALQEARRIVWLQEANPMGLEILEHRFGGMISRAKNTIRRIESYLAGEVAILEELEEPRLDPDPRANKAEPQAIIYNRALRIMSRSRATW